MKGPLVFATTGRRGMLDVFVLGILRRLGEGDLRHDGVTDQQRDALHVLTGKGLATFGEQPEPRLSRLSWRITDKGKDQL